MHALAGVIGLQSQQTTCKHYFKLARYVLNRRDCYNACFLLISMLYYFFKRVCSSGYLTFYVFKLRPGPIRGFTV